MHLENQGGVELPQSVVYPADGDLGDVGGSPLNRVVDGLALGVAAVLGVPRRDVFQTSFSPPQGLDVTVLEAQPLLLGTPLLNAGIGLVPRVVDLLGLAQGDAR